MPNRHSKSPDLFHNIFLGLFVWKRIQTKSTLGWCGSEEVFQSIGLPIPLFKFFPLVIYRFRKMGDLTCKLFHILDFARCFCRRSCSSASGMRCKMVMKSGRLISVWVHGAVIEYDSQGGLSPTEVYFSVLEPGSVGAGCQPSWVLVMTLFRVALVYQI